jgi:hypothetical protein
MKIKHWSILAAVVAASSVATSALAFQTHDPILVSAQDTSRTSDPDLLSLMRHQNGSPKSKPDLYVSSPASGPTPDLVRRVQYQNGSPKGKPDLYVITPAPGPTFDLVAQVRYQHGSPKGKPDLYLANSPLFKNSQQFMIAPLK